jgi:predicted DNA-binding protein YlxM (UPF0122 family)
VSAEKCVYTLKEIADELKVDKQKVYRFVVRNHISEVHHEALRDAVRNESGEQDEIDFWRNQIIRMNEHIASQNEQIRQQGEVINSLNRELEKEREHKRL